jgi:hypothetical protein
MSFLFCPRQDDPFTRQVRVTYRANVVGAPRAGIDPLSTLAVRGRKVEPRGQLRAMLDGGPVELPPVTSAETAGLTAVRSAAVDVRLGLSLSARFLAALGVPVPGGKVSASLWDGASSFSFGVRDVVEHQIDIGELGQRLNGRTLARTPATELFLTDHSVQLMLITRTLTTGSFTVRAVRNGGQSVQVAADGLATLLGKADADVSWKTEDDHSVTFTGQTPVTFAFSAVPCAIDAARNLMFGLARDDLTFAARRPSAGDPEDRPAIDRLGLLSFDELDGQPTGPPTG